MKICLICLNTYSQIFFNNLISHYIYINVFLHTDKIASHNAISFSVFTFYLHDFV